MVLVDQLLMIVFIGQNNESPIEAVPAGEKCLVTLDALVINNFNGSAAFRASKVVRSNGSNVEILSKKPHITALVATGSKPADSVKFVMKTYETVTIIPIDIEIETVCVWN